MEVIPATRTVPAMAVPREDPRLETLRDRPEIALKLLTEARLYDVDRRRQHEAKAQSDEEQSGHEGPHTRGTDHHGEQGAYADECDHEARKDERPLCSPLR